MTVERNRIATSPFPAIFGNSRAVSVEIGPGAGEFLIAAAQREPARNFYAIERAVPRVRQITARIETLGLGNAVVIRADAACLLQLLPDACVDTYHVQFPDPWWKRRHHRRRLITGELIATLRRTLVPGGRIEFMTDVSEYFTRVLRHLDDDAGLERVTAGPLPHHTTSFARKALRRGAGIMAATYRRSSGSGAPLPAR